MYIFLIRYLHSVPVYIYMPVFPLKIRYQKEIDRLVKENKDLRKSLMLKEVKSGRKRSMRVNSITSCSMCELF